MKKVFALAFAALAAFTFTSCEDPEIEKDKTETGDITKVCINEVCGVSGYKAVELYNADTKEVSLEGITLIKNEAVDATTGKEEATWTGTADDKIPAKGYFVIAAKKETTEITAVINATAKDSFSPKQTLKLVLKNGTVELSSFVRGVAPWGEAIDDAGEYSFGRTTDGGATWKLTDKTLGAANAGDHGDIPQTLTPAN